MAIRSLTVILLFALLGLVSADQICMRTQVSFSKHDYSNRNVKGGGTDCALRVKAWVDNDWKYAFIDKHSSTNWVDTEYGLAYVSKQRVHEHTDSCFEMQAGFGNVNLEKDIYVKFTDPNCNDALWIDRFFVPGRNKAWGVLNEKGWCMNGKKDLEVGHAAGEMFSSTQFETENGMTHVSFENGCAREWRLAPNGWVFAVEWGSSSGNGVRGSGRRILREVEPPVQDVRFMGLTESERREISLIESLYDVCENFDLGENFDLSDRYEYETKQIVRRCYDMLFRFQETYQEFQDKEERTFLPAEHRFATKEEEIALAADRFPPSEETKRISTDSETSESDPMNRLMSTIRSLP